ncbi:MAG: double-strand break repair protein AddB [Alphaproteobacteria bacterium]
MGPETLTGIFTIPSGADFAASLAGGLLADSQARRVPLADYLILLPTRRAGRTLREAFIAENNGAAMLLPRLQPLGDLDPEELTFAETAANIGGQDIPPAVAPLRRQFLLAGELRRHDAALSADGAWLLAGSLAALLDEAQTHGLDFAGLDKIVPDELAEHWQDVLRFLHVVTERWPAMLAATGMIDPVVRRNLLLERQAALWEAHPPDFPVIAAGSTGSIPATAELLRVVAHMPPGAVVLPGLDVECDAESWDAVTAAHPQHGMKSLLEKISVERRHVEIWSGGSIHNAARAGLLQAALAPAESSSSWRQSGHKPISSDAFGGLALCECETTEEEARTIALMLRAALETPKRTAALVTRDRLLAERVAAQMRRWDIEINDSSGRSLAATACGGFMSLIRAAAEPDASGVDFLALLKHPLAALGYDTMACRDLARLAEHRLWRGRRLRGAPEIHARTLEELNWKGDAGERQAIAEILGRLDRALHPLTALLRGESAPLAELLGAHIGAAEAVAADAHESGAARLWKHDDGDAAAALLHELAVSAGDFTLPGGDYAALFDMMLAAQSVRPKYSLHPRLSILGPLEARMIRADLVILGGMNEDSWPGAAAVDPFMSRPMRRQFGLPEPEAHVGQAAHDFVQLASQGEIVVTRARRAGGQPAAPSRFLLRLETLLKALGHESVPPPREPWIDWARKMDRPQAVAAMNPPCPKPPAGLRPKRFSVTEIGNWRRNPYGFYARRVLRLKPLGDLDPDFGGADHGIVIHGLLQQFIADHMRDFPPPEEAATELMRRGEGAFALLRDQPAAFALWWARFENSARWFAETEYRRRADAKPLATEAEGVMRWTLDGAGYELTGRADRIDLQSGGSSIIDYKTGRVPSGREIEAGYEPQLPLLAAMAANGAFPDIQTRHVAALAYWKLTGRESGGEIALLKAPEELMARARAMLDDTVRSFADAAMPYLVTPQPRYVPGHDDYRDLGRIDEWGLAAGDGEA